ncbi:MAG: radical SAM family heme chaperone HemW [Gammaproteobacteria bacterium]|nr:radical SAM family heme chaperone HemW [Gammaproteobacteria bacterium]MCZ6854196.1 radical SAM family heme chaperone HemW [Gammaproteobacteria bacterium]
MREARTTHLTIPLSLYVHFPWCVRKCPYCDFNSHPLSGTLDEAGYLLALQQDLKTQLDGISLSSIQSIFFGGGTPSLFSPEAFAELLDGLAALIAPDAEVTMEANPGTTEYHNFHEYRAAGINRLSLGAQSFSDVQLERLGRIHSAFETRESFAKAREGGFDNVNLDLMYGLAQQTVDEAMFDLESAIALTPEHISWYQLTIEPKTEFARRPPILASETSVERMEVCGQALLAEAGYQRYEVSAYAKDSHRCQHNMNYWRFGDYLGAGAGAHGKRSSATGIFRTSKPRQPRLYLADPDATSRNRLKTSELAAEFMMNALRLSDGVPFELFTQHTGLALEAISERWQELVDLELVSDERLAATALGYRHLDSLIQRFL